MIAHPVCGTRPVARDHRREGRIIGVVEAAASSPGRSAYRVRGRTSSTRPRSSPACPRRRPGSHRLPTRRAGPRAGASPLQARQRCCRRWVGAGRPLAFAVAPLVPFGDGKGEGLWADWPLLSKVSGWYILMHGRLAAVRDESRTPGVMACRPPVLLCCCNSRPPGIPGGRWFMGVSLPPSSRPGRRPPRRGFSSPGR